MKLFLKIIQKLEILGALLAGLSLSLMFGLGLLEIILRVGFGQGLPFSLEYSGYLVALSFLLGSGWAFRHGAHVRLDLLNIPEKWRKGLETAVLGVAFALSASLSVGLILWTLGSFEMRSVSYFPSATPLWIPQMVINLGPLILSASIFGRLLEHLTGKNL